MLCGDESLLRAPQTPQNSDSPGRPCRSSVAVNFFLGRAPDKSENVLKCLVSE